MGLPADSGYACRYKMGLFDTVIRKIDTSRNSLRIKWYKLVCPGGISYF